MPRNPSKIDYTGGLPQGFESFSIIEDPRAPGKTLHHFGEVLFLCVTGVLCGMNGFAEISHFGKKQISWFRQWGKFSHGIPTGQTLSNIFSLVNPDQFQKCLIAHIKQLNPELKKNIIALDGKSLRGSHSHLRKAQHAVSAWAVDPGVTLAQCFVDEKSNEITAFPKLLELLDLKEKIITIDAMGTQTKIAKQIIEQGGDYVLAVKGNQESTLKAVEDHIHFGLKQVDLKKTKRWSHYIAKTDHSHNRKTQRTVLSCHDLAGMDQEILNHWEGMKSIMLVETESEFVSTDKKRKTERRYYISSLESDAKEFHDIVRKHWSIENQCHWVIDVTFKEDANRTRIENAPKNFSTLLRMALNILKMDSSLKGSIPYKRREALLDHTYREKLLFSRT